MRTFIERFMIDTIGSVDAPLGLEIFFDVETQKCVARITCHGDAVLSGRDLGNTLSATGDGFTQALAELDVLCARELHG